MTSTHGSPRRRQSPAPSPVGAVAINVLDEMERVDRQAFDADVRLLDVPPELAHALPEVAKRMEIMHRCAYGLDAILRLQRAADLRRDQFDAGNDVEILRPYTAGGLQYAAAALVDVILRETDAFCGTEVHHG